MHSRHGSGAALDLVSGEIEGAGGSAFHYAGDTVLADFASAVAAAAIPGARFVALEGRNHLILEDEPAWPRFLEEVRSFLGSGGAG